MSTEDLLPHITEQQKYEWQHGAAEITELQHEAAEITDWPHSAAEITERHHRAAETERD